MGLICMLDSYRHWFDRGGPKGGVQAGYVPGAGKDQDVKCVDKRSEEDKKLIKDIDCALKNPGKLVKIFKSGGTKLRR